MTRSAAAALVLACAAVPTSRLGADAPAPQATFRTGVDLVALTVTVTDGADRHVAGLTERDFVVTDDGVPQQVSFFSSESLPLDLGIVLDTSGSMGGGRLKIVQDAACGLVRTLRPGDRGAVIEVKRGAQVPQPLTDDLRLVETAVRATKPGGDTGLYDGLFIALQQFTLARRESAEIRRQALVVLSDGADNASHLEFDRVLDLARRVGVGVYVVSPKTLPLASDTGRELAYLSRMDYSMKALVRESGGRLFASVTSPELHRVYGAIATELSHQYELGYVPTRAVSDGRYHAVSVQVPGRPGVLARTRAGYVAAASRQ